MKAKMPAPVTVAEMDAKLQTAAGPRAVSVQAALIILGTLTDGETDVFDVLRIAEYIDAGKGVDD